MRIVHLSTASNGGGAYRAAYRLHAALRKIGCDSTMCVGRCERDGEGVRELVFSRAPAARLRRFFRRHLFARSRPWRDDGSGREGFDGDRSQYGRELCAALPPHDVLHLHFVSGLLDFPAFFADGPSPRRIVWTLHDMWPFTGGCHFDGGCARYERGCGCCPALGSGNAGDASACSWRRKAEALRRVAPDRLRVVAPSKWLAACARRSPFLGRFPIDVIPYGVESTLFMPRDRAMAREVLGLPAGACIVLFVAQELTNARKGMAWLLEALARLRDFPNLHLVSVGAGMPCSGFSIPWTHLGVMDREGLLTLAYSAADLFVAPSLQDNLPNAVLEALACGVPVVGGDTGGLPDVVRLGVTGRLVPPGDVEALAVAVRDVLEDPERRAGMAAQCRRVAAEELAPEMQARRYLGIYQAIGS